MIASLTVDVYAISPGNVAFFIIMIFFTPSLLLRLFRYGEDADLRGKKKFGYIIKLWGEKKISQFVEKTLLTGFSKLTTCSILGFWYAPRRTWMKNDCLDLLDWYWRYRSVCQCWSRIASVTLSHLSCSRKACIARRCLRIPTTSFAFFHSLPVRSVAGMWSRTGANSGTLTAIISVFRRIIRMPDSAILG